MKDKVKDNIELNTFVKKKDGKIVEIKKSYENKLTGFEKYTGKEEPNIEKKPAYDIDKMWNILEEEIPALKKYRKSVREG